MQTKRRWYKALRVISQVALLIGVIWGVQRWQSRNVARGPAPALEGYGLDAERLSIAQLRGRPAMVHFWATWCGVCRAEEGTIAKLAEDTPMVTVAVSSGDQNAVRNYLVKRGVRMPVIVDPDGDLAARFGVNAYPTTLVLDGEGRVASVAVGYTTSLGLRARLWLAK